MQTSAWILTIVGSAILVLAMGANFVVSSRRRTPNLQTRVTVYAASILGSAMAVIGGIFLLPG